MMAEQRPKRVGLLLKLLLFIFWDISGDIEVLCGYIYMYILSTNLRNKNNAAEVSYRKKLKCWGRSMWGECTEFRDMSYSVVRCNVRQF